MRLPRLFALCTLLPLIAQPVARPAPRNHHTLTYDAANRRVLLYGGVTPDANGNVPPHSDLWSWNGEHWAAVSMNTGAPVIGAELFVDGAGTVFRTGGSATTARWTSGTWTPVVEDTAMRRVGFAAAYDTKRRRLVIHGGSARPQSVLGDTREFDGAAWKEVATNGPPPMMTASMVYDERRGVIVLFGGRNTVTRTAYGDTWEWNGGSWTHVAVDGPVPRSAAGMAYDANRGETVLFGGFDSGGTALDDTWRWNGRAWTKSPATGPAGRGEFEMAFDSARGVTVLFGGFGGTPAHSLGDTWEWNGSAWRRVVGDN